MAALDLRSGAVIGRGPSLGPRPGFDSLQAQEVFMHAVGVFVTVQSANVEAPAASIGPEQTGELALKTVQRRTFFKRSTLLVEAPFYGRRPNASTALAPEGPPHMISPPRATERGSGIKR